MSGRIITPTRSGNRPVTAAPLPPARRADRPDRAGEPSEDPLPHEVVVERVLAHGEGLDPDDAETVLLVEPVRSRVAAAHAEPDPRRAVRPGQLDAGVHQPGRQAVPVRVRDD